MTIPLSSYRPIACYRCVALSPYRCLIPLSLVIAVYRLIALSLRHYQNGLLPVLRIATVPIADRGHQRVDRVVPASTLPDPGIVRDELIIRGVTRQH